MDYNTWMDKFMTGWKERDVEAVMKIIAPDCKYYENVFDEPCSSFEDIKKLWEVVPTNQKDIEYSYDIISQDDKFAMIHFKVKRTALPSEQVMEMDGIFQVSLNAEGQCTFFKQWRSVRKL